MPEQGTAGNGPQDDGAVATATATAEQASFYAGTYKTKEEAEKGFVEKEETINRLRSERDKLRQQTEQLVNKFVETQKQSTPTPAPLDRKSIVALIDEKGGEAIVDVVERVLQEKDAEYERKYGSALNEMRKQLLDRDPDMLQYKDKVKELATELGVDEVQNRDLLLKMAKKLSKGQQPDRPELPGSSATTVIPSSQGPIVLRDIDASMLEGVETIGKLTAEEKAALAKMKADTADRRRNRQ